MLPGAATVLLFLLFGGNPDKLSPTFFYEGGPPPLQDSLQDLRSRAAAILRRAREARAAGEIEKHHLLLGEAAFLVGRIAESEGKYIDADHHYQTAKRYGYAHVTPFVHQEPPISSTYAPVPGRMHPQDPHRPRPDLPFHGSDLWELYRWQPYPSPRNNTFHSLINIPPMESSATLPEFTFAFRSSFDYDTANVRKTSEGGLTQYNAYHHSESSQFDYGVNPLIQVGFRLTGGEVRATSSTRVTAFESGTQIVRRGDREYNLESLVLRGKVHHDLFTFMETGLLAEIKLPLDNRYDFLTASTVDFGLSLLATKKWEYLALNVNVGGVFPIGSADDIFRANDEFGAVLAFGAGLVYSRRRFAVGVQIEGNTSPFKDISVLRNPVAQMIGHGKFELNRNLYVGVAVGTGLTKWSTDFYVSGGLTFAY